MHLLTQTFLQTIASVHRLDYIQLSLHRHRSMPFVCWYLICYCLLFLASTVYVLSCPYACDFVMFLFAFSCVINVQQFRQFLRFCNSAAILFATLIYCCTRQKGGCLCWIKSHIVAKVQSLIKNEKVLPYLIWVYHVIYMELISKQSAYR